MKLHLSAAELLEEWMARRLGTTMRRDCLMEPSGAFAIEEYAMMELRSWYADLLATAPADMLAPVDLAGEASVSVLPGRVAQLTLPSRAVRLVEARAPGWLRAAQIVENPEAPLAVAQRNIFTQGGPAHPVVVRSAPRTYLAYSLPHPDASPAFTSLLCVVEPDEGYFDLDERALALIPNFNI